MTQELWPVIGGKLGYIQFPGTETEPPKSGPQVAQHLEHIYKEYLSLFDTIYIASYVQEASKRRLTQQAQLQNQAQQQQPQQQLIRPPVQYQPTITGGLLRPGEPGVANGPGQFNMTALIQYAYTSASELRMKGLPEKIIQWIEEKRNVLQKAHDHHMRARNMQSGQVGGPSTAQTMQSSQQMLSNVPPAAASALASATAFGRRHQLPNGGQSFNQRSSETALNIAMGISGENSMGQRPPQPANPVNQGPNVPAGQLRRRTTQEEMNNATMFVQRTKKEFMTRSKQCMVL
jgi:hypothetical protein